MKVRLPHIKKRKIIFGSLATMAGVILLLPILFAGYIKVRDKIHPPFREQFPVTVDLVNKTILEDEKVEAFLSEGFDFQALAINSVLKLGNFLDVFAIGLSKLTGRNSLALVNGEKMVIIESGLRKEEVANAFARALKWNETQKKEFLTPKEGESLPMAEGSFFPGAYVVAKGATPTEVQGLVNQRFINDVLSHYGTSTTEVVPLDVALTVASLIERETIGTNDMRIVSGIIWNRIFAGMKLQLDASLQYVKASQKKNGIWWPKVGSQDKFIVSPYNTYMHKGLPPTPIANPSVAAIIAALNPAKTDCIFYFHDDDGDMHCTATYEEHVALLKKFYGRGK